MMDRLEHWTVGDAHDLAYLVAAAVGRGSGNAEAIGGLAALTSRIAGQARQTDDVALALLAAQLPQRVLARSPAAATTYVEQWTSTAIDSMAVALADLDDARRFPLAQVGGQLLAHVSGVDASPVAELVRQVCTPETLNAWGMRHMWPLIDRMSVIAEVAPDLAVDVGAAVWEYEDSRDDPTSLVDSAIIGMTSSRKQDVDGARYHVGTSYTQLAEVDIGAATALFLRMIESPANYRWPSGIDFDAPPRPRLGDALRYSSGHHVLLPVTTSWIEQVSRLADSVSVSAECSDEQTKSQRLLESIVVDQVIEQLQHTEVWYRLLYQAAIAKQTTLAEALRPALLVPNLYAHSTTWLPAAHLACRLSPLLSASDHAALEIAVLNLVSAGRRPRRQQAADRTHLDTRRDMIVGCMEPDRLQTDEARLRVDAGLALASLPTLTDYHDREMIWEREPAAESSTEHLRNQISEADTQTRSSDESERTQATESLFALWATVSSAPETPEAPAADALGETIDDVRLSLAARLASVPAVLPATSAGSEIYAALQAALPDPANPAADDDPGTLWTNPAAPAWSSTTTTTSLQGFVALVARPEWRAVHGPELITLLRPILDSPNPIYRYLVITALPALHPEPDDLFEETRRRVESETDTHILISVTNLLGRRFHHTHSHEIDRILRHLANEPRWEFITDDPSADDLGDELAAVAVSLLTLLAVKHETSYASTVVRAWLSNPIDHPHRTELVAISLRDVLNPADAELHPAQERAFELLEFSINPLRDAWHELEQAGSQATSQARDRGSRALKIADTISLQVHFATGALDELQPAAPTSNRGESGRFTDLALSLLKGLSGIHYPSVTHHIIQSIERLLPQRPRLALLVAAHAVTNDAGYAREQLGIDAVVTLTRRYLSEHRDLLREDAACLSAVRSLLEVFVRAGWDKAIELSEELDDLFG